jgi:hypothetical protein
MARITEVSPGDRDRIVALLCAEIDNARERITSEAAWRTLEQFFYEALCDQHTLSAMRVLDWAKAGHPAADHAIRRYGAEGLDRYQESEFLAQVRGYLVQALLRPYVPYPRGRNVVQNMMRDIWIPVVMDHVADATGLPATRNRTTTTPSAAYFLALALKKRGFKRLGEPEINQIYWRRKGIGARLEVEMLAITPPSAL